MSHEEILEKQVEALEKLLQLRAAVIEELESKVTTLQNEVAKQNANSYPGTVNIPWVGQPMPWNPNIGLPYTGPNSGSIVISNTCPDGTPHQYPNMWGGILPPACSKCGQASSLSTTVTCQNNNGVVSGHPFHTSGYVAPIVTTGLVQNIDPADKDNVYTLTNVAK